MQTDNARTYAIGDFLKQAASLPVFDVRTPSEFAQGHIPGAVNLPLFSDEERVVIGTMYKHEGREPSIKRGLEFVGPKMHGFIDAVQEKAGKGPVLVHCWRGGMRSGAMSWLLNFYGIPAWTLQGGYKTFRHWVLSVFERPYDLRVLGGLTGSGKTDLLHRMAAMGAQVIDLEALACHRGSAFGGIGQPPQPTTEHFENQLAFQLDRLDITRPVWVEDESRLIGRNQIPKALFDNKSEAPVYVIDVPHEARVARLVSDYGAFPKEELAARIQKIHDQLGGERCREALEALDAGRLDGVAALMLHHYDRVYRSALQKKADLVKVVIDAGEKHPDEVAAALLKALSDEATTNEDEVDSDHAGNNTR